MECPSLATIFKANTCTCGNGLVRCFALVVTAALASTIGTDATYGQRLLTLGPEQENPRSVGGGPVSISSPLSVGRRAHIVRVDVDLVRSAPPRLDLPTPDGRLLTAELSVFEDRGEGDVLWSGRFTGADHDSVALTIAGGGLAGYFGEPSGAKYRIAAAKDGRGLIVDTLPPPGQMLEPWCGVDVEAGHSLHEHLADIVGRRPLESPRPHSAMPHGVATPQSGDELKILVLYTKSAVRYWEDPSRNPLAVGYMAALQHAADYLTMVFRNGQLGLEPVLVFAPAPAWLDTYSSDGIYTADPAFGFFLRGDAELLRRRHSADFVHLFHWETVVRTFSGVAYLLAGYSSVGEPRTFAHEVGHNLGGTHQPGVQAWSRETTIEEYEAGRLAEWSLYAFAHAWHSDGTPVADGERGRYGTALAYPSTEPYYSTVRITPGGQQMGIAGERENERALQQTVSDHALQNLRDKGKPWPPTSLRAEMTSSTSVRLMWTDNAVDESSYFVSLEARDLEIVLDPEGAWTPLGRHVGIRLEANREHLDVKDLVPGLYHFQVEARGQYGYTPGLNLVYGAPFAVPGAEPAAPTDVSVRLIDRNLACAQLELTWTERLTEKDLQYPSAEHEIQVLREHRILWRRGVLAGTESYLLSGLSGCLEGGQYSFRLYSHAAGGRSPASETVTIEVPPQLKAVLGVPATIKAGVPAVFDGSASIRADSYEWFFGDGTYILHPNTVSRPSHTYTHPGSYRVRLQVAAAGDCDGGYRGYCGSSLASAMVEVEAGLPPTASFDFSAKCEDDLCIVWTGQEVVFDDASTGTVESLHWDFGDGESSTDRAPRHAWSSPGFYRVVLTAAGLGTTSTASRDVLVRRNNPAGTCEPDAETLCLQDSRYQVRTQWSKSDGQRGAASVAYAGSNDSGLFWFFGRENWEVLIKVLDGCGFNGNVWIYIASTTDLGYKVAVTDTVTGIVKEYRNEPGRPAPAVTDNEAFPDACRR